MSTDPLGIGGKGAASGLVERSKGALPAVRSQPAQVDFLDTPTPEDMARSRVALGEGASELDVLDHARKGRGGRRKGSQNRRSKDFEAYIRSFGRDPAVTLMEIQNTPPEVLVERSKALDPEKRRLSYGDAQALRVRCAEVLLPYVHGKKPVQVELGVDGDFNLIIPGLNASVEDARAAASGQFVLEADYEDVAEERGE